LFLLVWVNRVSADVVEKQRNFGAVLHRRNEQVGQLESVTPFILVAPLNIDNRFAIIRAIRRCSITRAQKLMCSHFRDQQMDIATNPN